MTHHSSVNGEEFQKIKECCATLVNRVVTTVPNVLSVCTVCSQYPSMGSSFYDWLSILQLQGGESVPPKETSEHHTERVKQLSRQSRRTISLGVGTSASAPSSAASHVVSFNQGGTFSRQRKGRGGGIACEAK